MKAGAPLRGRRVDRKRTVRSAMMQEGWPRSRAVRTSSSSVMFFRVNLADQRLPAAFQSQPATASKTVYRGPCLLPSACVPARARQRFAP